MDEKTATPELSKMVLDQRKDGDRLVAMARQHAAKLGASVTATLGPQHGAAAEALVRALADRTAQHVKAMVDADVGLSIELADDAAPRARRDLQERLTREAIVKVRQRVVGLYGDAILSVLMLASGAPKDPRQLATFALRAADVIAKRKPESFPEPEIEGGRPSPKKWAAALREPAELLEKALADVDREAAEAVTAQTERNQKRDAYAAFGPRARDLLEGFLRFAGMDAEADRLDRPVGSTSAVESEPVPPSPTPPAPPEG